MAEHLSIPPAVGIPTRVGRYRVLCELGTGSMASLYLGRAGGIGGFERLFALKVVHPHLGRRPAFIEMFLNEARIAASVHHPNVVPVYEVDVDDGQYFLAMDYVSGETLALLLRSTWNMKKKLPVRIAAHIVASAAEGLHAAHELTDASGASRNVVHRDVAPQNIMIGYDGIVRVTDFGIAKAMDTVSQTKPGVLKGTVAYMSPEQVRGLELDRRVDVFALGVLLWEATTGLRLFKDSTDIRTAGRILKMNVPPPSTMADDYPEGLDPIVMKALAKNREERYQSAREFSEDLFSFLATEERVTASEMERYIKDIFAERLKQRRALERDAADPEPPEDIGDHLSDASQTLGLEHFTAQEAWEEIGSDELEVLAPSAPSNVSELSAALRGTAAIPEPSEELDAPDTEADRPRGLPRNIVEKHHATTSKMPIPKFSEGDAKVITPKSILPSGRVSVKVEAEPPKKKSILPPFDKSKRAKADAASELTEASIGSAIQAALELAPTDVAADAPTLDEEPVVSAPTEARVADPANAPVDSATPVAGAFESDAPEVTRLPRAKAEEPKAVLVRSISQAKIQITRSEKSTGDDKVKVTAAPSSTEMLEEIDASEVMALDDDAGSSDVPAVEDDAIGAAVDALFGGADADATADSGAKPAPVAATPAIEAKPAPAKGEATKDDAPTSDDIVATRAELIFSTDPTKPDASGPVPKFSQRDVQTALIRDTGPIPLVRPDVALIPAEDTKRETTAMIREADVLETAPEDTQRVPNPLPPAEPAEPAESDFFAEDDAPEDDVFSAGSQPDEAFDSIAAEEQNARRTRVLVLAVASVLLVGTVFALWPSSDAPADSVAAAERTDAPTDDVDEPELVAPKPLSAAAAMADPGDEEPEAPSAETAEPERAAEPRTVSLRVEATPRAAEVLLDGRPYTGPQDVPLDADADHVVRVQAPGHKPQMIVVTAAEDRVVRVELEREAPPPEAVPTADTDEEPPKADKPKRRRRVRREVKKRTRKRNTPILFDGDDL